MSASHQTNVRKVLLAEGRKLVREGLCALLERHDDIRVVGEVEDSRAALKLIGALGIDVVVLNVTPPLHGGVEHVRAMTRAHPKVRIVVLTMDPAGEVLREVLGAGAHGCLTRDSSATELVEAIHTVMAGKTYLSPRLVDVMVNGYARPAPSQPLMRSLTPREREILGHVAAGATTKEIAQALGLGAKTIETHRRRMMQKLDMHSVAELTKYAIVQGLTPLDSAL
jgi:DNA-binding NarL/FixJ family response regulator